VKAKHSPDTVRQTEQLPARSDQGSNLLDRVSGWSRWEPNPHHPSILRPYHTPPVCSHPAWPALYRSSEGVSPGDPFEGYVRERQRHMPAPLQGETVCGPEIRISEPFVIRVSSGDEREPYAQWERVLTSIGRDFPAIFLVSVGICFISRSASSSLASGSPSWASSTMHAAAELKMESAEPHQPGTLGALSIDRSTPIRFILQDIEAVQRALPIRQHEVVHSIVPLDRRERTFFLLKSVDLPSTYAAAECIPA